MTKKLRLAAWFAGFFLIGGAGAMLVRARIDSAPPAQEEASHRDRARHEESTHAAHDPAASHEPTGSDPRKPAPAREDHSRMDMPEVSRSAAIEGITDLANPVCPIMRGPVPEPSPADIVYNGLRVHFCCPPCSSKFLSDPAASLRWMKDELGLDVPEASLRLEANPPVVDLRNPTSPVSGKPTRPDDPGSPRVVHHGLIVWLADPGEIAAFVADGDRHLRALASEGIEIPDGRLP